MLQLERDDLVSHHGTELCASVSHTLWLQRESLEDLLYALVTEQLVVTSGNTRWLARADGDVRAAMEALQAGELARAAEVDALARTLGLSADVGLAELAAAVAEPWATLFDEHRTALRALAFEVQGVADENHRLLEAGAKAVRDTLAGVTAVVTRYDATGSATRSTPTAWLLDEQA